MNPFQIIHKAIKRHAGLSSFDDEAVDSEVKAILRALKKHDFVIMRRQQRSSGLYEYVFP